jgi:hypothetical protein
MGEKRKALGGGGWKKYFNERNHLEEQILDRRTERKWVLKKWMLRAYTGLISFG